MKGAILVLAFAAAAMAACPNSCSGHGRCNEVDRCICYTASGTKVGRRDGWTGADCSQRTCPFGRSFDVISDATQEIISPIGHVPVARGAGATAVNTMSAYMTNGLHVKFDYNVEVEVLTYTAAGDGTGTGMFRYKRDVDAAFSSPTSFDTSSGSLTYATAAGAFELTTVVDNVNMKTGVWIYFGVGSLSATDYYYAGDTWYINATYNEGYRFSVAEDNSAHQLAECSGRGTCNRATGQCECFSGYSGDTCGRTTCPNDCSSHGVCQSLSRFAGDASQSYSGYDSSKNMGCKCDAGYRGPDCSQLECPSGKDPMGGPGADGTWDNAGTSTTSAAMDCSGRGVCDYTTGTCVCAMGYFGERCESQSNFL